MPHGTAFDLNQGEVRIQADAEKEEARPKQGETDPEVTVPAPGGVRGDVREFGRAFP